MNPVTAVTWGPFIQAAYEQFVSDPGQANPAAITNMPAAFAARYGALITVSWRIYNQVDVVPYFPVDIFDSHQPVTTGYAINSLGKAKWNLGCAHALNTYLHVLSPATVPLDPACSQPPGTGYGRHPRHNRVLVASLRPGAAARHDRYAAGRLAYGGKRRFPRQRAAARVAHGQPPHAWHLPAGHRSKHRARRGWS